MTRFKKYSYLIVDRKVLKMTKIVYFLYFALKIGIFHACRSFDTENT